MKTDVTSMFFNSTIEGKTATPAWGTSIGQSKLRECRIDDFKPEVVNMLIGMTYKSVSDLSKLDVSKGSSKREIVLCSVFTDIYINEIKINNSQFVLLLVREHSDSHDGRLIVSYAPYISYNNVSNQVCVNNMRKSIHCNEHGCWFVYDISIKNQSQLHFKAVVVDANNPKNYDKTATSQMRSSEWNAMIPEDGEKTMIVSEPFPESVTLQQIFYGAPGTGKSYRIKEKLKTMNVPKENIFRTTFHPDSDYSSFVGAYKPAMKPVADKYKAVVGKDEEIAYSFVPQTFVKAYIKAYQKPDEHIYLIIEEINRGNCAQIFGDLFQLLDRDENGVSEYPIKADSDLRTYLDKELGANHDGIKEGELCLPSNLYIWATMNTSDQSLFPIDSAFKRRWDWEYEPIKYKNIDWKIVIDGTGYSWVSFQRIVNERILRANSSEDKMLGDYFVTPSDGIITDKVLLNKILFYLWNDVCKDGEGDIFRVSETEDVSFSELYGENGTKTLKKMMSYLGVTAPDGNKVTIENDEENTEL